MNYEVQGQSEEALICNTPVEKYRYPGRDQQQAQQGNGYPLTSAAVEPGSDLRKQKRPPRERRTLSPASFRRHFDRIKSGIKEEEDIGGRQRPQHSY